MILVEQKFSDISSVIKINNNTKKNKMRLVKTIKTQNEILKLYNDKILGSESINIGGRQYFMMRESIHFNNKEINRRVDNVISMNSIRSCKCNNCGQTKSVDNFYRDSHSSRGYHNRCKQCTKSIREEQLKMVG